MTNRLSAESSPYLLQHAHNPVEWYPWSDEAIARATSEDRPLLLSIGYSSCHWCHVMERESFEDEDTAQLMNELFVNVKVDREERPDIDQVYMKAVQAMTGGGGWPLTVFLTPELVPYFGGTYFPPTPRHGLPSFRQVLRAASEAYRTRPEAVRDGGARLVEALAATTRPASDGDEVGEEVLKSTAETLGERFDPVHGGFGRAPKFPQPVVLELMLREHLRTGEPAPLERAVHTLRRMAAGGLRDHLAGGFHRYSVDARWLVPHFEKMLYDNALLARAYLDAYRVTGAEDLRDVVEETLDYLLADMRGPEGGFYSARDADSEGEEGTFYLWSSAQVEDALEPDDARLFRRLYDVSDGGNFEGRNILHLPHDLPSVAKSEGVPVAELKRRMADARARLHAVRAEREPPFRDEKVLVAWNGMAVRALAEAGPPLGRWDWVDEAERSAEFLWSELRREERLLHTWKDGVAKLPAFLDDHAALGNAFLSLHGATLASRWLERARWLCEEVLARFHDEATGAVYDTPHDGETLFLRPRDPMDSATPSGPSLAAELLLRAGHLFDDERYRDTSRRIVAHDASMLRQHGPAFGRMLSVLDRSLAAPVEIVVVGRRDDDATRALLHEAHRHLLRAGASAGRIEGEEPYATPLLQERGLVDGRPAAYLCRGYSCRLPVTEPAALAKEMDSMR